MALHTPGPWIKRTNPDDPAQLWIDSAEGSPVADLKDNGMQEGNADLIAAAPDLLASLATLEQRLTAVADAFYVDGSAKALRGAFDGWISDIKPARAAIAKARGE